METPENYPAPSSTIVITSYHCKICWRTSLGRRRTKPCLQRTSTGRALRSSPVASAWKGRHRTLSQRVTTCHNVSHCDMTRVSQKSQDSTIGPLLPLGKGLVMMALLENVVPSMIKANHWRRYVVSLLSVKSRTTQNLGTIWHHSILLDLSTKEGQTENWEAPVTLQRLCAWICHGFYIALAAAWDSLWLSLYLFPLCPEAVSARLRKALDAFDTMKPCPGVKQILECLRVSTDVWSQMISSVSWPSHGCCLDLWSFALLLGLGCNQNVWVIDLNMLES